MISFPRIRSLRVRLALWYGAVLTAALGTFTGLVYWRADHDMHRRAEEQIVSAASYLDVHLRSIPASEFNSGGEIPITSPQEPYAALPRPPRGAPPPPRSDELEFIIWRESGSVLAASSGIEDAWRTATPPLAQREVRLLRYPEELRAVELGPFHSTILVIRPLQRDLDHLHGFAWRLAAIGGGILAIGLFGGYWIAGRIVRPIAAISKTASTISATSLADRIDDRHIDAELAGLAQVLNATFARLQGSFERLTQFTADASHELRTPLAVLHTQMELALSRPRSAEEYQATLATCLRAAGGMQSLVDGLLTLARADAGRLELNLRPLDLRAIAADATESMQDRAEQAGITLECQLPLEPVMVAADSLFLARVPANLLANALQNTPAGGRIEVAVATEGDQAVLSVQDTGCGIAAENLAQLFERFYRVDTSRSRAVGGHGLGLAICRGLVVAHGGTIDCKSTLGSGSRFEVRLPLAKK